MRLYLASRVSNPTSIPRMKPWLHFVATLTVKRELPKYEIASRASVSR